MMEQMTLDELKTGMHVVLRNGDEMIVMKGAREGTEVLVNLPNTPTEHGTLLDLNLYNNNMTHQHYFDNDSMSKFDIVKVYDIAIYEKAAFTNIKDNHNYDSKIIYTEEIMTKAEAEEKFGIRIVD